MRKLKDYRHVADSEDPRKLKHESAEGVNGVGEAVSDKPTGTSLLPKGSVTRRTSYQAARRMCTVGQKDWFKA